MYLSISCTSFSKPTNNPNANYIEVIQPYIRNFQHERSIFVKKKSAGISSQANSIRDGVGEGSVASEKNRKKNFRKIFSSEHATDRNMEVYSTYHHT